MSLLLVVVFSIFRLQDTVFAEQSGSSPESGVTSRIKIAYDWLVAKGDNYGSTDATDWSNNWGSMWNRILEAAAWEPDGTATESSVPSGQTFYSGNNNRDRRIGTMFEAQGLQDYDDWNCTGNNAESSSSCSSGNNEYVGEEGTWTLTASGGTARSVTDNSVTLTLTSNKVYQDNLTRLYWSDANAGGNIVDNEFQYIDGDDRVNPIGNSCNFNSSGDANSYCDNQDPLNAYAQDNDVSAAEFCLNLQLDADNADNDNDGATGMETDWRLPTQKELQQAYINGAGNNLPTLDQLPFWGSTEYYFTESNAATISLYFGRSVTQVKNVNSSVRCVRRD